MPLETLLRVLLAVSVVLATALLMNAILVRGSAALRHRLWSLSVVAVLMIPLLVPLLPQWKLGWAIGAESQPTVSSQSVVPSSPVARATPAVNREISDTGRRGAIRQASPDETVVDTQPPIRVRRRNRDQSDGTAQPAVSSTTVQPGPADRTDATDTAQTAVSNDVTPTTAAVPLVVIAWGVWLAGVGVVLVRLAASLWHARRIVRHSAAISTVELPVSFEDLSSTFATRLNPELLESPLTDSPLCIGSLRPRIVLPVNHRSWSADELRCVLLHELAHVARHDVAWQIAARMACAVYWFHPLVWLAAWRMCVERESACDDAVLTRGEPSSRYARLLLNLAAELSRRGIRENSAARASAAAIPMAAGSRVEHRIRAVLSPQRCRSAVNRRTGRLLAAAALAIATFAAVLNPMEAAPTADVPYASGTQQPAGSAAAASNQKKQSAKASVVKDKSQTELPVRVTGVVVDEKGNPVAGARVRVTGAFLLRKKVTTGADGRFAIPVEKKQARGIMVAARNDDGTRQALIRRSPNPRSREPITNLSLTLHQARTISLTVLDAGRKPVAGVWTAAIVSYRELDETQTDARGRAVLRVPAGADATLQAVIAAKDGIGLNYILYRRPNEPASDPYRLAQDESKPLTLVLNGAQTVTVRVVDEAGKPVTGATVYPWHFQKPKKGNGRFGDINVAGVSHFHKTTDGRGIATFNMVPADQSRRIQFWAQRDGYYMPRNDRDFYGPQNVSPKVTLRLLKLLPITGRVTFPDGKPAANFGVQIVGAGYQFDRFHNTAHTNADGRFRIGVYPNQYYQFVAGNRKWASPGVSTVILEKAPPEIQLRLQPATRVFGRVTFGSDSAPVSGQYLMLTKQDDTYYKLPKDKRLPNPSGSNRGISAQMSQSTQTGKDGRFEFFAGPGRFYIMGVGNAKIPHFEITDQTEVTVNIHAPRPERGPIAGRVVRRGKPEQGVSNARIKGAATNFRLAWLEAVSGKSGRFQATRGLSDMVVHARSSDGKLQGLVKITADATRFVIPVGPTATAHGRLVDQESGKPLAKRQLQYGIRITGTDGTFMTVFGGSTTTGDDGSFTAKGLVPGWNYELNLVVGTDSNGQARGWTTAGSVTAKKVETVDLGTIKVKPPYREPTIDDRIQTYFDKRKPLKERLASAREQAELLHKRVLVIIGRPKLAATKELFSLRFDVGSGLSAAFGSYGLLCLDATRPALAAAGRKLAARTGATWPKSDDVALVVLDASGKLVAQTSTSELSVGRKLSSDKLKKFLDVHKPEFPDAKKLLADALAQAKKEGKSVLLQHSGPQCYPCLLLSRFVQKHAELVAKDYVYVHIDERYKHGKDVIDRTRKGKERSIPWMVVLDGDGKPRITSDGPKGNIGFPSEPEGIAQFRKMLQATRRNLTDGEIRSLLKALVAKP